jgi:Protein of unknown function (DUF2585)
MNVPAKSGSSERVFTWQIACFLFAILIVHAATLHFMGRIAWCKCGFGLWTSHAWSSETSQMLADPYSATHVVHGILFYVVLHFLVPRASLRVRFMAAVIAEIGWEIFENTPFVINRYRAATASLDYTGDSVLNSVGDVLSAILGFWLAARLPWKVSLAIVVGLELLLLVTVRDNLTLNILMILYPIEAIKRWQTAS